MCTTTEQPERFHVSQQRKQEGTLELHHAILGGRMMGGEYSRRPGDFDALRETLEVERAGDRPVGGDGSGGCSCENGGN